MNPHALPRDYGQLVASEIERMSSLRAGLYLTDKANIPEYMGSSKCICWVSRAEWFTQL